MSFNEFDTTEVDKGKADYAEEAKERWGKTDAYAQSQKKTAHYTKEDWNRINGEREDLQKKFAECRGEDPASEKVQELVRLWQKHITDYYYDCTKEILSGLGQMYVMDERFTKKINKCGEGTAKFMNEAFEVYCQK